MAANVRWPPFSHSSREQAVSDVDMQILWGMHPDGDEWSGNAFGASLQGLRTRKGTVVISPIGRPARIVVAESV